MENGGGGKGKGIKKVLDLDFSRHHAFWGGRGAWNSTEPCLAGDWTKKVKTKKDEGGSERGCTLFLRCEVGTYWEKTSEAIGRKKDGR